MTIDLPNQVCVFRIGYMVFQLFKPRKFKIRPSDATNLKNQLMQPASTKVLCRINQRNNFVQLVL